ncbi:MAG: lytic transglycosylase domain-containing protein [Treponemataceae bacterium]|nr:lytic transglycosylase domain-containing protein [Treponemataceae bacterium]
MMIRKLFLLVFAVESVLLFCACGRDLSPQAVFQEDSDYFLGLLSLRDGNVGKAERLFRRCSERGSALCARRSLEMLARLGNVQKRQEACERLVARYGDDQAVLAAAKEFAADGEYARLLRATDGVDPASSDNELVALRLDALRRRNDSRYRRELYAWFLERPLDVRHYQFFRGCEADFEVPEELPAEAEEGRSAALQNAAVRLRVEVFRRNYGAAFQLFQAFCQALPLAPYIVSDMGKACLYGSHDNLQNARRFDSFAARPDGSGAAFYSWFYAGRLYEAAGSHDASALDRYRSAMDAAPADENYDNALWYFLNAVMKRSLDDAVSAIKETCPTWRSPEYFDDLLETLAPLLLSAHRWNDFSELYRALDGHASDAMTAKYAYLYGRLVQEGFAVPAGGAGSGDAEAAFARALTSGGDPYYCVMAIHRLGLGGEFAEEALCNIAPPAEQEADAGAERLLLGYAAFGLPDRIYPEWLSLSGRGIRIRLDAALKLASFLNECGGNRNEYYPQGLRIAVRAVSLAERPIVPDDLRLVYPRNYGRIVEENCGRFAVPEEILYALIRSESFFDSQIESSAGAVGLTQLMAPTAGDIARKLKYDDYDLKDAALNVEFGTYYLAELSRRLDGAWLPAFFAYNAGISRVRRWMESARIGFDRSAPLPIDLFLETVPYQETRGYGQKLIGASALYGWLYYGKSVSDVVSELLAQPGV